MTKKLLPLLLAAILLLASTAGAQAWITDLSTEELKDRMDQPRLLVAVDTRTEQEYRQGHISGAINIPSHQFEQIDRHLPDNKSTPVVFYCRGYD